ILKDKSYHLHMSEALGSPKKQGLEEHMKKLIPTSKSNFVLNANNQDTMPRLVKKDKHGKKSQEETQASQASAPVPDEVKKSTQASQVSTPVPEEALESTQSKIIKSKEEAPKLSVQASQASSETPQSTAQPTTLTFGPPRAPEQRHTFGDFLSKQSGKSSTSVLEAAKLTFIAGGTVRAPITTKRPRPHGPGSTPFMPAGPASQPWVPPGQVGDAPFKATKKILPPLALGPLPTSRKKFQVVKPK
ncbi:hypothetical protein IFM89_027735, partial [Coptis chinensis]